MNKKEYIHKENIARIYICGPSGTGKTTLAKWVSEEFGIPFITTSTKPLWNEFGITSHKELIEKADKDPHFGFAFQMRLLDYRIEKLKSDSWITDRSPVDNLMYFMMQNLHHCTEAQYVEYAIRCQAALSSGTHLIISPMLNDIKLENDGMRISNRHYQMFTSIVMDYALKELSTSNTIKKCKRLENWDWEDRKQIITKFLTK